MIVYRLRFAVDGHFGSGRGADFGKDLILKGVSRQQRHIVSGGMMITPIQPGGGHKAGVVHTYFLGCAVHFGNERLRAAGKKDGCRIGSVVAADQQHAYHQIVQRDPIPHMQSQGRALCVFQHSGCYRHRSLQVPGCTSQVGGHNFGGRGHRPFFISILFIQHRVSGSVHHHGALGAGGRQRRHRHQQKQT